MTHKVNKKGVAIEHPPKNNKAKRIRNGINQLGPEKDIPIQNTKLFLDVEKKYYTFCKLKLKVGLPKKIKKNIIKN